MGGGHQNLRLAKQHSARALDQHPVLRRNQHVARRQAHAKGTGQMCTGCSRGSAIRSARLRLRRPTQRKGCSPWSRVTSKSPAPDVRQPPTRDRSNHRARGKAGNNLFNVGKGHRPDNRACAVKKFDRAVFRVHRIVDDIGQRPAPAGQIQRVKSPLFSPPSTSPRTCLQRVVSVPPSMRSSPASTVKARRQHRQKAVAPKPPTIRHRRRRHKQNHPRHRRKLYRFPFRRKSSSLSPPNNRSCRPRRQAYLARPALKLLIPGPA